MNQIAIALQNFAYLTIVMLFGQLHLGHQFHIAVQVFKVIHRLASLPEGLVCLY